MSRSRYSPIAACDSYLHGFVAGTASVVGSHTNTMTFGDRLAYNGFMVESFGGYESACKGKRKFDSEDDARIAAKELRKRVGARVKPYLCGHCQMWHNGHFRRIVIDRIRPLLTDKSIEKY